ncbi:MAG: 6-phosphogluconolactonase [Planctomycetota bacterium]|jgi:6-phosphogluconolactonase
MQGPLITSPAKDMDFTSFASLIIAQEIGRCIGEHGKCSIALSGGNTPREIYERLAKAYIPGKRKSQWEIPWDNVEVFFGDERCVSPYDDASNYRMAHNSLLKHLPVLPERIHRIEAENIDREKAAIEYEKILPEELDILLLGMGEDGHTASIFPGSPVFDEEYVERKVMHVVGPVLPPERITITPRVIEKAKMRFVITKGESKAETVDRAINGPFNPEEIPVQLALHGLWILDEDAKINLERRKA